MRGLIGCFDSDVEHGSRRRASRDGAAARGTAAAPARRHDGARHSSEALRLPCSTSTCLQINQRDATDNGLPAYPFAQYDSMECFEIHFLALGIIIRSNLRLHTPVCAHNPGTPGDATHHRPLSAPPRCPKPELGLDGGYRECELRPSITPWRPPSPPRWAPEVSPPLVTPHGSLCSPCTDTGGASVPPL